jgi:hypothetical protein
MTLTTGVAVGMTHDRRSQARRNGLVSWTSPVADDACHVSPQVLAPLGILRLGAVGEHRHGLLGKPAAPPGTGDAAAQDRDL